MAYELSVLSEICHKKFERQGGNNMSIHAMKNEAEYSPS